MEDAEQLTYIPGVGKTISQDLRKIGIRCVSDLKGKNPEELYALSNRCAGARQDRCLLYVFRTAVYFAGGGRDPALLKWWNWKDKKLNSAPGQCFARTPQRNTQ
ncbi:MAG: pathogenicity locus [Dehalococcoidia bacterium]|nr:pathogenicity locus [Dehalococcoidia bacterium]